MTTRLFGMDMALLNPLSVALHPLGRCSGQFDYVEQNPRCTQAAIVHPGRTKQQINEAVGRIELGLLKMQVVGDYSLITLHKIASLPS